ncbi:MAG: hypothetical protein Q4D14_04585, partial [Bacteroidales bacterium]|nr:hypothetical protein [Bacteroidales bacterium]
MAVCLITLIVVSCKPVEQVRVATGATFYHWRYNQLKQQYDNNEINAYTSFGVNNILTCDDLKRDTICFYYEESLDEYGRFLKTIHKKKLVRDLYMEDGHTYVTGKILSEIRAYTYSSLEPGSGQIQLTYEGYPFLEIDGVIKDITPKDIGEHAPYCLWGSRFYHDGKDLYTIIEGELDTLTFPWGERKYHDFYVSKNGGDSYYIATFANFDIYDMAKVGDEWYEVGSADNLPLYQRSSEYGSSIYLGKPNDGGGIIMDIIDYHGEALMVGRYHAQPFVMYNDSITYLPTPTGEVMD